MLLLICNITDLVNNKVRFTPYNFPRSYITYLVELLNSNTFLKDCLALEQLTDYNVGKDLDIIGLNILSFEGDYLQIEFSRLHAYINI